MDIIIESAASNNILTIIISAFLAFFAYKQWKTEEEKKRLELFEKRFEFYKFLMLNPLWKLLFYKKDEIPFEFEADEKLESPPLKYILEQAYFLFPKRIYDKIVLVGAKLYFLSGQQSLANYTREVNTKNPKISKEFCVEFANIIEDHFIKDKILELKKEYEYLFDILHNFIAIERQITIWEIIGNILLSAWDFIIPYKSKALKHNRKTEEEVNEWIKQIKKERDENK